jgi:hypothetical protein
MYTSLIGDANIPVNIINTAIGYPAAEFVDTFSTLYLPRVYGKGLDYFEIASSGKIAFTVTDRHVLDLAYDNSTINFQIAHETDSLKISNSNSFILFDAPTSNIYLSSANKVIFEASNGISFDGSDYMTLQGDTLTFSASNNAYISAESNVYITAVQDIIMSAAGGSVLFHLDPPNSNIYFTASNNVTFTAADGYMRFNQGQESVFIDMRSNTLSLSADTIDMGFVTVQDNEFAVNKYEDWRRLKYCFEFSNDDLLMTRKTYSNNILFEKKMVNRYSVAAN